MKERKKPGRAGNEGVIRLEDLAPRKDPKGGTGSGKTVFGGEPLPAGPDGEARPAKKRRREKK